jgi:hypothetical protein
LSDEDSLEELEEKEERLFRLLGEHPPVLSTLREGTK